MRNLIVPAVVAGFLASAAVAFAAQQTTGTLKSVDLNAMTITLKDGTIYYLPQNFRNPGLKPGQQVQISWDMQNGQHDAVTVQIVK